MRTLIGIPNLTSFNETRRPGDLIVTSVATLPVCQATSTKSADDMQRRGRPGMHMRNQNGMVAAERVPEELECTSECFRARGVGLEGGASKIYLPCTPTDWGEVRGRPGLRLRCSGHWTIVWSNVVPYTRKFVSRVGDFRDRQFSALFSTLPRGLESILRF